MSNSSPPVQHVYSENVRLELGSTAVTPVRRADPVEQVQPSNAVPAQQSKPIPEGPDEVHHADSHRSIDGVGDGSGDGSGDAIGEGSGEGSNGSSDEKHQRTQSAAPALGNPSVQQSADERKLPHGSQKPDAPKS